MQITEEQIRKIAVSHQRQMSSVHPHAIIGTIEDAINEALVIAVVSVRCCANCSHFNYDAPRLDQPYPEFWCGKEHWCGISCSEEYEALNEPFECVDFNAR